MVADRTSFMATGNKSKEDGDLPDLEKKVKAYLDRTAAEEAAELLLKKAAKDKSEDLDKSECAVLDLESASRGKVTTTS